MTTALPGLLHFPCAAAAAADSHATTSRTCMPSADNLIWIDLEMTGLRTETDQIIEIATVVTDKELNVLAEGPVLALHQSDEVLAGMDSWNQRQHGSSGLIERVRASSVTAAEAQRRTLEF